MPITRHDREAAHTLIADEVIQFGPFIERATEVSPAKARITLPGHGVVSPAGKFCGSARMSSVPFVAPQIFHVAFDAAKRTLEPSFLRRAQAPSPANRCAQSSVSVFSPSWMLCGGLPPA